MSGLPVRLAPRKGDCIGRGRQPVEEPATATQLNGLINDDLTFAVSSFKW